MKVDDLPFVQQRFVGVFRPFESRDGLRAQVVLVDAVYPIVGEFVELQASPDFPLEEILEEGYPIR